MKNKLVLEVVWWVVTLVVIALVMLPIYGRIKTAYPFYYQNLVIIIIAITFCRYIFMLKHHWLSSRKWIKVLFIFIPIPIFFFLTGAFYDFQAYSDEKGITSFLSMLPFKEQVGLAKYIRAEMILFWATAFLANLFMPIRMVISIWREINKGTH